MRSADTSNRLPILADEIKKAHAGVRASALAAAEYAIAAGHALTEAKAMLKHGEWLPWLRDHAGCSERSARLYMQIVRLGFKPATVADLGLKAAANAIGVIHDATYDPFHGFTEEEVRDWLLFQLFLTSRQGASADGVEHHIERLLRNGWTLKDWLGQPGTAYRARWGYPMPTIGVVFQFEWTRFENERASVAAKDIQFELTMLGGASPGRCPFDSNE